MRGSFQRLHPGLGGMCLRSPVPSVLRSQSPTPSPSLLLREEAPRYEALECPGWSSSGLRMPCHQAAGCCKVLLSRQHQPPAPAAARPSVTEEVGIPSDSAMQCGSGWGACLALPRHEPRPLSAEVTAGYEGLDLAPPRIQLWEALPQKQLSCGPDTRPTAPPGPASNGIPSF